MATYLYRLGAWAFERRRAVAALWTLALAGVIAAAVAFGGSTNDKFSVPGTESQEAQELLEARYPAASGTSARIVFSAPEGEKLTDPANKALVEETMARAAGAQDVAAVTDPFATGTLTSDGRIGYGDVIYPVQAHEIDDAARDQLEASAEPAHAGGLEVEFGGGLVTENAEAGSESMGMMIGFLVLAITLGSLVAAGLPLLTALVGVGMGVTGLTALSGVFDVSSVAPTLATMLGLAVGIDYALFILTRYRQNLGAGMAPKEAAAAATATAGSAVVFAGLTVVIALVGLLVVNIPFLSVMGLAAAGTVAIAVLIAISLLPAILGFLGARGGRVDRWAGQAPGAQPAHAGGEGRDERPLGALRAPAPAARRHAQRGAPGRDRHPGRAHGARPAGQRLEADHVDGAPRLRHADGRLRPRVQRHAHRRGGRAGP
jgi:RND superfamily putative drug exporter